MNEIQLILLGLFVLGSSVAFFYHTGLIPRQIENTELNTIVSLGIGLLILIIGKRQNHYLDEIIQTQHKMTQEIHTMIKEEIRLINEMTSEKDKS